MSLFAQHLLFDAGANEAIAANELGNEAANFEEDAADFGAADPDDFISGFSPEAKESNNQVLDAAGGSPGGANLDFGVEDLSLQPAPKSLEKSQSTAAPVGTPDSKPAPETKVIAPPATPAPPMNVEAKAQPGEETSDPKENELQEAGSPSELPSDIPNPFDLQPTPKPLIPKSEFAGALPVLGGRRQLAESEAPEEYIIEKGDTLYDVCDQLIDEPDYWPKLWSFNPEIKNPHFVYPGMRLVFHSGDAESPPFMQIESEDDVLPVERHSELGTKELVTDAEDISKILVDHSAREEPEIIDPKDLDDAAGLDDIFEFDGRQPNTDKLSLTIPAFIFSSLPVELAEVLSGVSGSSLVDGPGELVIKNGGNVQIGTTYTVLRPSESVYAGEESDYVGERYEFVAQIRATKQIDSEYSSAVVVQNRLGIEKGDIVVSYLATSRTVSLRDNAPASFNSEHTILGFDYPQANLGGTGSFVLISNKDQGTLAAGQNMTVYQDQSRMAAIWGVDGLPRTKKAVAVIKVIDASGVAAVGYVLSSSQEIRVGDSAGAG